MLKVGHAKVALYKTSQGKMLFDPTPCFVQIKSFWVTKLPLLGVRYVLLHYQRQGFVSWVPNMPTHRSSIKFSFISVMIRLVLQDGQDV